ncbi:MAG: riboflavin synthase [bacterium]|nr:riboflavin synthase [bacterium]
MFTGIIRTIGIVKEIKNGVLQIIPKSLLQLKLGDSVAVNGVCLTVEEVLSRSHQKLFSFSLMSSTLGATTLGILKQGDVVNLELPLRYGDRVDGHFVLGHVDGVGEVVGVSKKQRSKETTVRVPTNLKKFCVAKGSIALDGVSLTIMSVRGRDVLVSLTPYTLKNTRFANVRVEDRVNVEVDVLARYRQSKNIIRAKPVP